MKPSEVLKILHLLSILVISNFTFAQFCAGDNRFSEIEYFPEEQIESMKNLVYGNAIDWQGNPVDLKLDIYYPGLSIDTIPGRPLIVLIHGGGFQNGHRTSLTVECKEFAKRGFVAATISYRLGHNPSIQNDIVKAAYRAQQDANAALRYLIDEAFNYKIDTSWIFMGGGSAGAITSLNTNYISQEEWDEVYPGIVASLGELNNSGNNLNHSFSLKGIFNNWGSTFGSAIDVDDMIPMVSFHGEDDQTVPIDSAATGLFGSRAIHHLLVSNNVCSDLTVKPNAGHGIYRLIQGKQFRIGRAICFLRSLFCDDCSSFYTTDSIPASCSAIVSQIDLTLEQGWNGISSYLQPIDQSISSIVEQLGGSFICIQNLDGIYYPGGSFSTIESWKLHSGYQIKVDQDTTFRIDGTQPDQNVLRIVPGWNLIPVLSSVPSNIDSLFGDNLYSIEIIKEAVGIKIYWPEMYINQIDSLLPGHSYFIMSQDTINASF